MRVRLGMAAASLCLSFGAYAQGTWKQGPPIPQGANEVIGGAVNGKMLVYGGQDGSGKSMGIFWMFDPATNQWSQLPSNPVPVHHGAAAAVGNKFYVFGGFRLPDSGKNGWWPEARAWVYDVDQKKWSELPHMAQPRGALAAVAVGKKIYVSGGAKIPEGKSFFIHTFKENLFRILIIRHIVLLVGDREVAHAFGDRMIRILHLHPEGTDRRVASIGGAEDIPEVGIG